MKQAFASLDKWHKTRVGYATFGTVELSLSYALISRAIHTGSWWQYLFGIIFLIGFIQSFVKVMKRKN